MWKKIILLILFLTLTGCRVEYNLTLDKYLMGSEEITFLERNNILLQGHNTIEASLISRLNNNYFTPGFDLYNKENLINDDISGIKINRNFRNICDVENSSVFDNLFAECDVSTEEGIVSVEFTLSEENVFSISSPDPSFYMEEIKLNINSFYLVTDGNYDNYSDGVMSWIFDNENYGDISFQIDTNYTNENIVVENSIFSEPKTFNPIYILIGIFVIILVGITYIYISYQKNNRI